MSDVLVGPRVFARQGEAWWWRLRAEIGLRREFGRLNLFPNNIGSRQGQCWRHRLALKGGGREISFVKKGRLVKGGLSIAPGSGLNTAGACGGGPEVVARFICKMISGAEMFAGTGGVPGSGLNFAGGNGGVFVVTIW